MAMHDAHTYSRPCALPCSNVFDLLKWYNTFSARPEVIGLSKESLALLTEPLEPIEANVSFAQGIGVELLPATGKLVRNKGSLSINKFLPPRPSSCASLMCSDGCRRTKA